MSPATATLIGAGVVIAVQLLTAVFLYGQIVFQVKSHGKRLSNLEEVVSGTGGHGERLTRLEVARLNRAHQHGD